jgi:hypothetical protein
VQREDAEDAEQHDKRGAAGAFMRLQPFVASADDARQTNQTPKVREHC